MEGFKSIFDEAEKEYAESSSKLESFRYVRNLYGFCINEGGRDEQALNYALNLNKELYERFISQPKGLVGYKNNEEKYLPIDDLDSKHILQLTFLFNNNKINYNRIVEIGGGFGNMARLINNIITYNSWDIIDIPHMLELQKYYLTTEITHVSKINFINGYSDIKYDKTPIDLVIGTHSISEFSWDIFCNYFQNVIKYSNYLYIGYNKNCPSPQLINAKLDYIKTNGFVLEKKFDYTEAPHGANVSYSLYKNVSILLP
jgi:hypothetical protein